jgi:hypothetical protein
MMFRTMRFPASIQLDCPCDGQPVLRTRSTAAPNRNVTSFCLLAMLGVLLVVPALRLIRQQTASYGAFSVRLNSDPAFTADAIRIEAAPVLAQLAPAHGHLEVIGGMGERPDGSAQRQWTVVCSSAPPRSNDFAPAAKGGGMAEVVYDGDTGELIHASAMCGLDGLPHDPTALRPRELTADEAVVEARAWLPKLGLAAVGKPGEPEVSPVHYTPQMSIVGTWRVWLRARETFNGPVVTVMVILSNRRRALMQAVVLERAAFPSPYLPRR